MVSSAIQLLSFPRPTLKDAFFRGKAGSGAAEYVDGAGETLQLLCGPSCLAPHCRYNKASLFSILLPLSFSFLLLLVFLFLFVTVFYFVRRWERDHLHYDYPVIISPEMLSCSAWGASAHCAFFELLALHIILTIFAIILVFGEVWGQGNHWQAELTHLFFLCSSSQDLQQIRQPRRR